MNKGVLKNREKLIKEVKGEYARLASAETQSHFQQTVTGITAEQYYENLLNMVIKEIERGTFDSFVSGHAIMEEVAKDKRGWLSDWK